MKGWWRWIALAIVVAAGAFLRFDALHEPSYWLDEILYQLLTETAAKQPWWQWLTTSNAEHAGLYYATQLILPGRVAAAIFGLVTIALTFLTARLVDERAAIPAAILLAVSPMHVYYSREARSYALLMLLTAALIAILLRGRSLIALCAALVAMLYTAALAVPIVIGACVVAAACAIRTRARWYGWAAAACALTLPLYRLLYSAKPYHDPGWSKFEVALGTFTSAWRLAAVMVVLAVIGAVVLVRRNAVAAIVLIGMTVVPLVTTVGALWYLDHFFAMRYIAPALIGFVLLMASASSGLRQRELPLSTPRWRAVAGATAVQSVPLLVAIAIATQTWPVARREPFQKLDWRQIAATIWKHSKPGDLIISAEPWSDISLRYYLDDFPPRAKLVHIFAADVADMQRQLYPNTWLVTAGFSSNTESRVWMCRFPLVLASPLEDFRLHYATPRMETFAAGWADAEPNFRWANARRSTIAIPRWTRRDEVITMRVLPVAPSQTMRVSLNGHLLGEVTLPHQWSDQSFRAPARYWIDGTNTLAFDFAFTRSPGGNDPRTLAVAFESLDTGEPLARITAFIDEKTLWRDTPTAFPAERLNPDGVLPLLTRLGFDPNVAWPRLRKGEVHLDNVVETVAWGPDCEDDRAFLRKAFAVLLERAPGPHEERELLALPRARIPGRIAKLSEFRGRVLR